MVCPIEDKDLFPKLLAKHLSEKTITQKAFDYFMDIHYVAKIFGIEVVNEAIVEMYNKAIYTITKEELIKILFPPLLNSIKESLIRLGFKNV